jgi:hypothetical protein
LNSTFHPFPSSVEGISEHLITLSQTKFSSEMYDKIEALTKNQSEFLEEITKIVGRPLELITIVDDFDEISESFSLKICWVFTLLTDFFISNVLAMLFIAYDKYGEDSMKRSLCNRLTSQIAYPLIINNILCQPAWAWRIYFGPIVSTAADMAVFIGKLKIKIQLQLENFIAFKFSVFIKTK